MKFVNKEIAIAVRDKGFDEPCIAHYRGYDIEPTSQIGHEISFEKNSDYDMSGTYFHTAPTYSDIIDWFREKHDISIELTTLLNGSKDRLFYKITLKTHHVRNCRSGHKGYIPDKKIEANADYSYDWYKSLTKAIEEALKLI